MWDARLEVAAMLQWALRGLFGKGRGVLTKGRLQEVESDEHGLGMRTQRFGHPSCDHTQCRYSEGMYIHKNYKHLNAKLDLTWRSAWVVHRPTRPRRIFGKYPTEEEKVSTFMLYI